MKKQSVISQKKTISSKTVFWIGTAVPFLLYLCAYIVNGVYPFGEKILLDADAFHQYLPFLTEFRRKLVSGSSLFYSFSGGLGYNLWASIAYYAASPMNLLLVFVPEANVCDFMVWMTVVKVSLCGGIFAWYLCKQNKDIPLFAVAFGVMYAFSNYLLGYKYNIMWLDSIAVVPLVMYGLERLVHGEHPGWYLISLFYAIWCNFYVGYMICIFSCLYLVFLFITEDGLDKGKRIKVSGVFLASSLAAGGMASILLFPVFFALQKSTAMVTGESAGFHFYNNIISMFRAHYMESEMFRTSFNEGDVHLYCGMAVLPLAALFFTDKNISKKLRIAYAAFLGVFLLSFTFSPLNFVWHGFHNQNSLPNRFSFLYDILLLKLCYTVLPNLKKTEERRLNRIILAIFGVSALFAVWDIVAQHSFRVSLSLGCLALYTVVLYEIRSNPKKEKQFAVILASLMIAEAGSYGFIDLSLSGEGWDRAYYLDYQKDFQQLIKDRKDDDFFRSEIDTELSNLITYVGGNGVSLFNSTMQDNIRRFLGGMNIHTDMNIVTNIGGTKLLNDLLGVRYFVTEKTDSERWNGFAKAASLNGKTLYYNEQALSIGFVVPKELVSWKPEEGNGMDGHNKLARIISELEAPYSYQQSFSGEDEKTVTFDIPEFSTIYAALDEIPYEITWETPEYTNTYNRRFHNLLLPAESTEDGKQASLRVKSLGGEQQYSGSIYSCREEDYRLITEALSENQMDEITVSGNTLSGKIQSDTDGILLLTIPYETGWQIKVDSTLSDYQEIGGALIGINLNAGEHQIEMRYTPDGFSIGCILSFVSLVLTLAILFYDKILLLRRKL